MATAGPSRISGAMGKLWGGTKVAGAVAGAGSLKAAAGAQAAGQAVGAVVSQGTALFVDTFADPGFIVFVVGIFAFLIEFAGNSLLAVFIASVFLFFTSIFIFKGRGIIVVSAFWVWYILFGGTFSVELTLYRIVPLFLFGMIVHGIFSKVNNSSFKEGFTGELAYGMVPIVFFFLDLGLIEFATGEAGLTLSGALRDFLIYTPWWTLLGLFTTKKDNLPINVSKIIAVGYLFIILVWGVAPQVYADFSASAPGPQELLAAKEELRVNNAGRENPAISTFKCMVENRFTDLEQCKTEKQEESELKAVCKDVPVIDECMARERKRRAQMTAGGAFDQEIQSFTKADIKINDQTFPKRVVRREGDVFVHRYVAELHLENPQGQSIGVRGSCVFKKGTQSIPGILTLAGGDNRVEVSGKVSDIALICTPGEEELDKFNGPMTVRYTATLEGLTTTSVLKRVFLSTGLDEDARAVQREYVLKSEFSSAADSLARAPQEFARINFGFGATENKPIIENEALIFVSSIENTKAGKIDRIKEYHFDLGERGFIADSDTCFAGSGSNLLLGSEKLQPLTSCFITVPYDYITFSAPYLVDTFSATLRYDYNITKDVGITVTVVSEENGVPMIPNEGSIS